MFKVKCFGLEGTENKKIIIFYNFHVGIKSFSTNNDQEVFYMPKENKKEKELTVVPEIDEKWFKDHIYEIRGQKVMLDSDLAVVYGYETKNFNRQVKNNVEKFEDDFMFQLTRNELEEISRCKIFTSIQTKGIKGGRSYLPYAFTEQGIYMLMTVLRGDLAVKQSKALIRLFKLMKDYIIKTNQTDQFFQYSKSLQTDSAHERINRLEERINTFVTKDELNTMMEPFNRLIEDNEMIIYQGQWFTANKAFNDIYRKAKHRIIIVDNYIGIGTLNNLIGIKNKIEIIIYTLNTKELPQDIFDNFIKEYHLKIKIIKLSRNYDHDRFIFIDNDYPKNRKEYVIGCSSKDAGKKLTTIIETDSLKELCEKIETDCRENEILLSSFRI